MKHIRSCQSVHDFLLAHCKHPAAHLHSSEYICSVQCVLSTTAASCHAWLQVCIDSQILHFYYMHTHVLLFTMVDLRHSICCQQPHIPSLQTKAMFYMAMLHDWNVICACSGAVQTLMSVDADRVVNLCASLHELWSLPAQIAIALYLLYTQVSNHLNQQSR